VQSHSAVEIKTCLILRFAVKYSINRWGHPFLCGHVTRWLWSQLWCTFYCTRQFFV